MRLRWHGDAEPDCGDVAVEVAYAGADPAELERAYLVVGVEEPSRAGAAWRLLLERVAYGREPEPGRVVWFFYADRR